MKIKIFWYPLVSICGASLVSCSATSALINHSNLEVNSKMSNTIFLDSQPMGHHTIFIQVKNTTPEDLNGITKDLVANFTQAGWEVVGNESMAYNMVQVNVLQAGEAENVKSVWSAVQSGYGDTILGGLAGLAVGYGTGSVIGGIGAGVGVAAISWIADSAIKNEAYSVITDIQVSVKVDDVVISKQQSNLKQGTDTVQSQNYVSNSHWLRYHTRVGTVAQKVNLKFTEAKPVIIKQLSKEIAGVFISDE